MNVFEKLKFEFAKSIAAHPLISTKIYSTIPHLKIFLPHDPTYYVFKNIAKKEGHPLFLDIGANNGISAQSFHKINPHYKIFSIEVNPIHEKSLKGMARKNNQFTYMIAGAGDISTEVKFYTPIYKGIKLSTETSSNKDFIDKRFAKMDPQKRSHFSLTSFTAKIIKIDDLNLSPDIIKIDCEGTELDVLKGSRKTIEEHTPHVLVEIMEDQLSQSIVSGISEFFTELNYSRFFIWTQEKIILSSTPFESKENFWSKNVLFIHNSKLNLVSKELFQ